MRNFLLGTLLLGSTLAFAQDKPAALAPAAPAPVAFAPAPKPDTAAVLRLRLKQYQAQQKEATKLAKIQTALSIEQLKYQAASKKAGQKVAVEQAKEN
jgi:hypothetical protein